MVLNIDEKYKARIASMKEYTYDWQPQNYDDPSQPILKITKSSLGSFDWCAKKYQFNYIERRPQDQTEAMKKGTILHNSREEFFEVFDIKKAEGMNATEILDYCTSLMPVDDYFDISLTVAAFEAQRYLDARTEGKVHEYLPIINEELFDCEITIPKDIHPKFTLERDYVIHLQGIIDRVFIEDGNLIPFEYKTGAWSTSPAKKTSMRKEMAFYKLMIENCEEEILDKFGLSKDMEVTHWGWYYPASDFVFTEKVQKRSTTAVMHGIAKLIHAYEQKQFKARQFYANICTNCSYFGICEDALQDTWM